MLSRCANPECGKLLHYLREGKVFLFNVPHAATSGVRTPQREHFWLCGECSQIYTMIQMENQAAVLVPLRIATRRDYAHTSMDAQGSRQLNIVAAAS